MSVSDNDSDVSEDGISMKIDSKGTKDCNVSHKLQLANAVIADVSAGLNRAYGLF